MSNNSPAYIPYIRSIYICVCALPHLPFNSKRELLNCATGYIRETYTASSLHKTKLNFRTVHYLVEGVKLLSKTFANGRCHWFLFLRLRIFDTLRFIEHAALQTRRLYGLFFRTISGNGFLVWKRPAGGKRYAAFDLFIAGPCRLAWSRVCGGSSRWSWSPLIRLISRLSSPSREWILRSRAPRILLSRQRSSTVPSKAAARRPSSGWDYYTFISCAVSDYR